MSQPAEQPSPRDPDAVDPAVETARRLEKQYADFATLVGGLAHEIKNPLSTIRLNLELLNEDFTAAQTPKERRAAAKLAVVQRECQRLQDLLDDFLNYAKVRHPHLRPTNLNQLVAQVLEFFAPTAAEMNIEVLQFLDADLPSVLLDADTFRSALLNLVLNAQQSMPDGGQLVLRTRMTGGRVALDLIDTGCGMDSKTLTRAFDAFYSTKPGGSGLGLPTTRKIVEAHGGTLHVQSDVGRGSQFTIELPVPPRLTAE
ncbi:MAG: sensor histidine kinase [Planctomycetota bacterium]|nr:MAG: sensor histidine kinase [Planctomycetota bacterium]REJ87597.1 MAG: sensor histidine kinase [Planctomycetota bacterium]REK30147.1 MAG: sensor histidine kinase [Planctomycetota bacterium]REK43326.1 MAG: sensor histidine kinase [Planctomycetota bacterium]